MNVQAAIIEDYRANYRQTVPQLVGANIPWMRQLRDEGMARFEQGGFPTTRMEAWKYTRLTELEKQPYLFHAKDSPALGETLLQGLPQVALPAYSLLFVDGIFVKETSDLGAMPEGVKILSLAAAMEQGEEPLHELLASRQNADAAFTALNDAFMSDGAYVYLPAGVSLDRPIHLQFVTTVEQGTAIYPRNLVVMEDESHACLIETHIGLDMAGGMSDVHGTVRLGSNARLDHYKLQLEPPGTLHIASLEVEQADTSRFESHLLALGSRLMRNEIHVDLVGEGAECLLNGLFLTQERQHFDLHTRIDHRVPHCTSREYYRGIADKRGRGVFDGKVLVRLNAQKSDALMQTHNLLLSPHAEIDAKPQLEIYADDVKCAHGATVGQLDEQALFYLRARGMSEGMARNLVIYAFASEIIERFELHELRRLGRELLLGRLPEGDQMSDGLLAVVRRRPEVTS